MITGLFTRRTVFTALSASIALILPACERKAPNSSPPPNAASDLTAKDKSVVFGEGFYKEEAVQSSVLRWVRQQGTLGLRAPANGTYQITFKLITVFSTAANVISVTVNGEPAGSCTTAAFDFDRPPQCTLKVKLQTGNNDVVLRSNLTEVQLGPNDNRSVGFGLILPVTVEQLP